MAKTTITFKVWQETNGRFFAEFKGGRSFKPKSFGGKTAIDAVRNALDAAEKADKREAEKPRKTGQGRRHKGEAVSAQFRGIGRKTS